MAAQSPQKPIHLHSLVRTNFHHGSLRKKDVYLQASRVWHRSTSNWPYSTIAAYGETSNLSPLSYFQVVDHDPPMFIVGFYSRPRAPKDTYRNLRETGECVINIVSKNMIPAVNATSIDALYGVTEWAISGLHQAPSATVAPPRFQDSVFSIEGRLTDKKDFETHAKPYAIDEGESHIDLKVLRPIAQLKGISYARISKIFELPRSNWDAAVKEENWLGNLPGTKDAKA